jgi:hypothetical protein
MLRSADVVSYLEMCARFGVHLQRGMNFRLRSAESLILMSVRPGAPYEDRVEQGGRVIVYQGHDMPPMKGGPDPTFVDQGEFQPNGRRTQNGLFTEAVRRFKSGKAPSEKVPVFEKIRDGVWVSNGLFELVDGWQETHERRPVFKFELRLVHEIEPASVDRTEELDHDRVIPTGVQLEVWERDKGRRTKCGAKDNLHFDHIIPYSEGGSSKDPKNLQILLRQTQSRELRQPRISPC